MAYKLKICNLAFSYLEGDYHDRKFLLQKEHIRDFKRRIIPEVEDIIREYSGEKWSKSMAISAVRSIFPERGISLKDYEAGIYRRPKPCLKPSFFSIVIANGDVHPCNMVEYTHFPVVGNLKTQTFRDIWDGKEWARFRERGFDLCQYCPVPHQVTIPITRKPEYAWAQYMLKNRFLMPVYPYLKRTVFSHKGLLKRIRKN
jgi:MoaA/NifB/PqqE/SkfB family radical SAM enzyme